MKKVTNKKVSKKKTTINKVIITTVLAILYLTGCQANHMKAGAAFLEEKNYTEAIASFQKAAENKKLAADASRGIAITYYEQKDYQNARDTFQQVIDQGGETTPELYNIMGICSMQLDDYQGALGSFEQGLGSVKDGDEEYAEIAQEMRFNQIVCYEKLLDWENAKAKAQEYSSLYQDDTEAEKEADFLSTR